MWKIDHKLVVEVESLDHKKGLEKPDRAASEHHIIEEVIMLSCSVEEEAITR